MKITPIIFAISTSIVTGCAGFTPNQVVKPSDISLDSAMQQTMYALHHAQDQYPPEKRLGLIADQVQIQFNVAATASNGSDAKLNIAAVPVGPANIGGSLDVQAAASANRGNIITITLKNALTADMSKSVYGMTHSKPAQASGHSGHVANNGNGTKPPVATSDTCIVYGVPCSGVVLSTGLTPEQKKAILKIVPDAKFTVSNAQ